MPDYARWSVSKLAKRFGVVAEALDAKLEQTNKTEVKIGKLFDESSSATITIHEELHDWDEDEDHKVARFRFPTKAKRKAAATGRLAISASREREVLKIGTLGRDAEAVALSPRLATQLGGISILLTNTEVEHDFHVLELEAREEVGGQADSNFKFVFGLGLEAIRVAGQKIT